MASFETWVKLRVVFNPNTRCRSRELYQDYLEHIGAPLMPPKMRSGVMTENAFGRLMRRVCKCGRVKAMGVTYFTGLTLREQEEV